MRPAFFLLLVVWLLLLFVCGFAAAFTIVIVTGVELQSLQPPERFLWSLFSSAVTAVSFVLQLHALMSLRSSKR